MLRFRRVSQSVRACDKASTSPFRTIPRRIACSFRTVCVASLPCKTLQRNGVSIAYVSKADVAFLYREIEEKDCYLQHGISLLRGGTVIDVGANIGIFAAYAARKVSSKGRVIACEPLPATFAALQYNMKSTLNAGMHSSMLPNCPALRMKSDCCCIWLQRNQ